MIEQDHEQIQAVLNILRSKSKVATNMLIELIMLDMRCNDGEIVYTAEQLVETIKHLKGE
jgi:hypothetical protein